jgi:hypothetical protein
MPIEAGPHPQDSSAAMIVVITAVMPRMPRIIAMMIMVVVIVARLDDTARRQDSQGHYHSALRHPFQIIHVILQ